jgi:hypothetical protein
VANVDLIPQCVCKGLDRPPTRNDVPGKMHGSVQFDEAHGPTFMKQSQAQVPQISAGEESCAGGRRRDGRLVVKWWAPSATPTDWGIRVVANLGE